MSQFRWKKVRNLFFCFFFQRHKEQSRWEETKKSAPKAKNQHRPCQWKAHFFNFTQLMLGRIWFNRRLRRNRKEKKKNWVTTNQLPSGFFVLFYMKYLEPHCCGLEAVSRFTPAYVESTHSRAHHPTCPRIEIPGDWCLLRHISPSCWAWLTATVWSQLMNSNQRLPFVIAWFASNVNILPHNSVMAVLLIPIRLVHAVLWGSSPPSCHFSRF